jgi:DNA-directed RNA polymerase subunit N (RpoN/RPB10)
MKLIYRCYYCGKVMFLGSKYTVYHKKCGEKAHMEYFKAHIVEPLRQYCNERQRECLNERGTV